MKPAHRSFKRLKTMHVMMLRYAEVYAEVYAEEYAEEYAEVHAAVRQGCSL